MLSFLPKFIFDKITDLKAEFLQENKIQLLLLDFDNTVLPYTKDVPEAELLLWLSHMKESGILLCILSNSHKDRVPKFSKAYGVPCITHACKPSTRGYKEAMAQFSVKRQHTAMVGDQIFADVLGANLAGITAIAVKSIDNHNFWLKLRHLFELPFLAMANKRRVKT